MYFCKLQKRDTKIGGFSPLINFSSVFLGRWFFYRHINKMMDQDTNYFYTLLKPSQNFNFSLRESNLYNLHLHSKIFGKTFNEKIDSYFRKNIEFNFNFYKKYENISPCKRFSSVKNKKEQGYGELDNTRFLVNGIKKGGVRKNFRYKNILQTIEIKKKKKFLTDRVRLKLFNFRKFRWNKSLGEFSNNLLNSGYNFRLPFKFKRKNLLKDILKSGLPVRAFRWRRLTRIYKKLSSPKQRDKDTAVFVNSFLLLSKNCNTNEGNSEIYYYFWFK